jgi:hypothetical protein
MNAHMRMTFLTTAAVFACMTGSLHANEDGATEARATAGAEKAIRWVGGFSLGLAIHESGHLVLGGALGVKPFLKGVDFHGVPFFAIDYRERLNSSQSLQLASAGFWTQYAASEWVLTRRPEIARDAAPFTKGVLAFHVLNSLGYTGAALLRTGPVERDSLGIARDLGVDERWVGVALLVPASLDVYRYYNPRRHWAAWLSRGVKLGLIVISIR